MYCFQVPVCYIFCLDSLLCKVYILEFACTKSQFLSLYFLPPSQGDGKCVICDSYVRPCTLVRICDECNYGSYQGRCVICGGPGVSDAYYCKECTIQEKDVSNPTWVLIIILSHASNSRMFGKLVDINIKGYCIQGYQLDLILNFISNLIMSLELSILLLIVVISQTTSLDCICFIIIKKL